MRQTLTYTPHVTLHPAESAVDQRGGGAAAGRGGENANEKEEGEKVEAKNAFQLFMARSFFSISRLISGFLWAGCAAVT